ncbi:MAG: cytochrome c [Candidatus Omnitrophica bacterium]|nr:cytochrome c [Candidatus Omnitrophota bacterium]
MRTIFRSILLVCFTGVFFNSFGLAQNQPEDIGRELYLSYGCAVCHGVLGDGKGMRKLEREMMPTNFTDGNSYRFGKDKNSIKHSIKFGIKEQGTVMPAFQHISDEELEAISLYLISLQKEK